MAKSTSYDVILEYAMLRADEGFTVEIIQIKRGDYRARATK